MPKTKKFIDKKNSVTFHLVHRSQRDPLVADETAPQRVLVPANNKQSVGNEKGANNVKNRKEEQHKYGVFYDDDYDYLQHLRDVNTLSTEWERIDNVKTVEKNVPKEKSKINLPSSVFESNVEEKIGLLNRAAPVSGPQLDLDPDIVAALDGDFDFDDPDNELEDDFIQLAKTEGPEDDDFEIDTCDVPFRNRDTVGRYEEEIIDSDSSHSGQCTFRDEETKSRFTEYSMSSNIMKRNENLTLLDNKFEKMYADYDENEIGALDYEEIEGYIDPDSNIILQCAEEYENHQKQATETMANLLKDHMKITDKEIFSSDENEDENDINLERVIVDVRGKNKWDCESVLSTYSNIYNHPKLISEPKGVHKITVDAKTGFPKDVLNGRGQSQLTVQNVLQFATVDRMPKTQGTCMDSNAIKSVVSELSVRSKNESPEQRKERKQALKEYRRERRKERKVNIEAFKEEKKRQEKILLNEKKNVQGNRIL